MRKSAGSNSNGAGGWTGRPEQIEKARIVLSVALSKRSAGELVRIIMDWLDDGDLYEFCRTYLEDGDLQRVRSG